MSEYVCTSRLRYMDVSNTIINHGKNREEHKKSGSKERGKRKRKIRFHRESVIQRTAKLVYWLVVLQRLETVKWIIKLLQACSKCVWNSGNSNSSSRSRGNNNSNSTALSIHLKHQQQRRPINQVYEFDGWFKCMSYQADRHKSAKKNTQQCRKAKWS